MKTLTTDDIIAIHSALTRDFATTNDPIFPPGVKTRGLLESAVWRQHVGWDGTLKYSNPLDNAATLMFGVCNNHSFHNGNKRTAIVSMLVHLDSNGLVLNETSRSDLFDLAIACADHKLLDGTINVRLSRQQRKSPDAEIHALSAWIRKRSNRLVKGQRQITYRELRRILSSFGFELDQESNAGNSAGIYKTIEVPRLLRKARIERKRIGAIGYHSEGAFVSITDIKRVRALCEIDEAHGVDDSSFYDQSAVVDAFIAKYQRTLRRLARR